MAMQNIQDKIDVLEALLVEIQEEQKEVTNNEALKDLARCEKDLDSAVNGFVGYMQYLEEKEFTASDKGS